MDSKGLFCPGGNHSEFVFFWKVDASGSTVSKSCLSHWYPCRFHADGTMYSSAEQYLMAEKALLMRDFDTYVQILATDDPAEAKKLGRQVRNFDQILWDRNCMKIAFKANLLKFSQNEQLLDFLLSTGDSILAEASPYDAIWGIGLAESDPRARHPRLWPGRNLLGSALMQVRFHLLDTQPKP